MRPYPPMYAPSLHRHSSVNSPVVLTYCAGVMLVDAVEMGVG